MEMRGLQMKYPMFRYNSTYFPEKEVKLPEWVELIRKRENIRIQCI